MEEKLAKERLKEIVEQGGEIPDDLRVALAKAVGADEDNVRDQLGGGSTAGSVPPFSGGRPATPEDGTKETQAALKKYDAIVAKRTDAAIENDKSFSTVGRARWEDVYGSKDNPAEADEAKSSKEGPIYPDDDSTNVPTSATGGRAKTTKARS